MALRTKLVKMRKRGSFLVATGQVTNESDSPIQHACAVVSYFNAEGAMIQMDSARIKHAVLDPGQTSPFRVVCLWNSQMVRGRIQVNEPACVTQAG
jgi:hypothetical protein